MTQSINVLVAEDNENDFFLLELALHQTRAHWQVQRVHDGVEALDYLRGEDRYADRHVYPEPEVIVLDLKMPRMTGLELLEWIRKSSRYRTIPTLIMSSSRDDVDVRKAYESGANTYFVKPTNFEELARLCQQIAGYWDQSVTPLF